MVTESFGSRRVLLALFVWLRMVSEGFMLVRSRLSGFLGLLSSPLLGKLPKEVVVMTSLGPSTED